MKGIICIDWDGCLADPKTGTMYPGAVDFIRRFTRLGLTVVILTCRASYPGGLLAVQDELLRKGVFKVEVTNVKPQALVYIDSHGVRGLPDRYDEAFREARKLVG